MVDVAERQLSTFAVVQLRASHDAIWRSSLVPKDEMNRGISPENFRTDDGRRVMFVAQPAMAPPSGRIHYARPDDVSDAGTSWREELTRYNGDSRDNPLGLSQAIALYTHRTYTRLAEKIDANKLFILSAGWGLLPASFLTPDYDITFSAQAEPYKRRRRADPYRDFAAPG